MHSFALRRRPRRRSEIEGNEDIIGSLPGCIPGGSRQHLTLCGSSGAGKTTTALVVAAEQLCLASEGQPCLICIGCLTREEGTNPAFHIVDCHHHGSKEDIEFLLDEETGREPLGASHHVIVFEEAGALSLAAQSGLLVALQSTTAHRQFIFTCIDPDALLRPLRDRCRVLRLELPDYPRALAFLERVAAQEKIAIDTPALELLAVASRGYRNLLENLETAAKLAGDRSIDAPLLRRTVLRDRSAIILDYIEAVADGDIDRQLALLDESALTAPELLRSIREVLVHLRLRSTRRHRLR